MKYVSVIGKKHKQKHPIDNGVIEYAARLTAESHNLEFPDDPWIVEISDDEAAADKEPE